MVIGVVVAQLLELVEQPALLVGQAARDGDVDEHAMVAVPEALQHRHPLAAEHATSPGWVPGSNSSSCTPSSVVTGSVVPSAAWTIVMLTWEKMSLPSRTKRSSGRTLTCT